ncbi:hypothetical protein KSP40_PGU022325 [Platanthera guangdongensis]|uniref:Protein CHUP1, chloroplastic n=1 Tax=Platanthera guangdongensis TaxID=2320717 RepID=A0ABR2M0B0_9ASPA
MNIFDLDAWRHQRSILAHPGEQTREDAEKATVIHFNGRAKPWAAWCAKLCPGTTLLGLSPSSRSTGDDEGFLLPEFNDLALKDFEISRNSPESTPSNPTPRRSDAKEDNSSIDQEISRLKNLVFSLRERERNLEIQLLQYRGMQERETAARELESRLKINDMEAQLFSLKIESLQSENQRLQALVLDHPAVTSELEAAKRKIKALKWSIKLDGEQAREKISSLHQMIVVLQDKEKMHGRDGLEMEMKVKRLKELEAEAGNLERRNSNLVNENLELKMELESAQKIANSVMEDWKAEKLAEVQNLKHSNEKLLKEIEQLQADRCSDVEELVYLKWVNACLRYELRNYQPPHGKTVARDLSTNLSPRSEEKAKQLILEYANSCADDKCMSPGDLDDYSSSHTSTGEPDDAFLESTSVNPKHRSSKFKFFSKLKKLVLHKNHHKDRVSSVDRTPARCSNSDGRVSLSNSSVDDAFGRDLYDSFYSSSMAEEIRTASQAQGAEFQKRRRINLEGRKEKGDCYKCDGESSRSLKRTVSVEENLMGSTHRRGTGEEEDNNMPEKGEIRKYAEVLKGQGFDGSAKPTNVCLSRVSLDRSINAEFAPSSSIKNAGNSSIEVVAFEEGKVKHQQRILKQLHA